jgi:hypothetical protein
MTRVSSYAVPGRGMGTATKRKGTDPVYTGYDLEESYKDNRDPEKVAKLYSEMVGFKNLADDEFVRDQAKTAVLGALKETLNTMEFLRNKWLVLYRLYRGENTMPTFGFGLHSPTPFKIVESIHPRLMRTIFGSERWFQLYGVGDRDDVAAKAQEALCRDQFRAMGYRAKASRFGRDGLIYGTAIQKTYWKQEVGERAYRKGRRKPNPANPGTTHVELEDVKRTELMFDGNDCIQIPIFDFLGPPGASSIADAEWACDRSLWPDYKVKQMIELGHWTGLESLRDDPGSDDGNFADEFKERKAYAYGVFDGRMAVPSPNVPHYQVIDWWGPLVIRKDENNYETKMCNVVMLQPEGKALIARVTENPFWHGKKPYQVWRPIDMSDELYGIGAIEMIARLSREKDKKRTLLMNATQLEGNPMWAVSDQSNIPPGQLVAQPGLVVRCPDPKNSVVPLAFPGVSDAALKAENILEAEMREVSGVTAPVIGVNDPMGGASKTATQSNNDLDEANMRLSGAIANFDLEVTCPMLEQMAWNNMQFCNYEKVIRDVGPMGIRFRDRYSIRPEDLIGQFIVQPLSGFRLMTKTTQVQQLVNLFDRAPVVNQMYGPNAVKMPKLLAYILEHGFDIRNADEFIQLPPEDTKLLTGLEETEMWYHGNVPPVRNDDNHLRHMLVHQEEIATERFKELERSDPSVASEAIAHIADHYRYVALVKEQQEKMLMEMAQAAAAQGIETGGVGAQSPEGAASPNQEPGSPKVRRNENERSGGPNKGTKSEAMANAPNEGAT